MKKLVAILCLMSSIALANDQVPHDCAVVDSDGTIVSIIRANPAAPDNDKSPIKGDTLVIVDGLGYQVGGTLIDGEYTPPAQ